MSLKPIIKSAREAIDRKDFDYALQLCTDALEYEPDNYFLLVFRAVALINGPKSDLEAALLSYTKATRSQPDNPLAYQVNQLQERLCKYFLKLIFRVSSICMKVRKWSRMSDITKPSTTSQIYILDSTLHIFINSIFKLL